MPITICPTGSAVTNPITTFGASLWSWHMAGVNGENCVLRNGAGCRTLIVSTVDLSGNGRTWTGRTGGVDPEPGTQNGTSFKPTFDWDTVYYCLGLDDFSCGATQFGNVYTAEAGLGATAEFYLAAMVATVRQPPGGNRYMWADTRNDHWVRYDESRGDINIRYSGLSRQLVDGLVPAGPVILEIWRDSSDDLHCRANNVVVTNGSPNAAGLADFKGWGQDWNAPIGSAQWDGYLFESIMVKGATTSGQRDDNRDYMNDLWEAY